MLKESKFNNCLQMLLSSITEEDMTVYTLKFSKVGKIFRKLADISNIWPTVLSAIKNCQNRQNSGELYLKYCQQVV